MDLAVVSITIVCLYIIWGTLLSRFDIDFKNEKMITININWIVLSLAPTSSHSRRKKYLLNCKVRHMQFVDHKPQCIDDSRRPHYKVLNVTILCNILSPTKYKSHRDFVQVITHANHLKIQHESGPRLTLKYFWMTSSTRITFGATSD